MFNFVKAYQESLKVYRDIKNVVETSKEEGREEGREQRNIEIAKEMRKNGEPIVLTKK